MNPFEKFIDLPASDEQFINDMDKRYNRTFVLIQLKKESPLGLFEVQNRVGDGIYRFVGPIDTNIDIKKNTVGDVQAFMPETGYYQYTNGAFYIYKDPQRQWKRSFCSNIYVITSPMNTLDNWSRLDNNTWRKMADAILTTKYVSLDKVTNNQNCNIALNKSFACAIDNNDQPHLCYRRVPIGNLDIQNKVITNVPDVIKQEVIDLLQRTGVKLWTLLK